MSAASRFRTALGRREGGGSLLHAIALAVLLGGVLTVSSAPALGGAVNYPAFNVTITGPSVLPTNGSSLYYAVASGGPAETLGGVYVGNYTFTDQIIGVNITGSFVTPSSGAFQGRDANLTVGGLVNPGTYTLELNVTSHGAGSPGTNLTQIFSYQISIVIPYLITASVVNDNSYTVSGATVDFLLDGALVGATSVPSLAPAGSTVVTFNYTAQVLSPGYHTFTLELVGAYGLLEFSNGQNTYSVTFYIQAPPTDYTSYWLIGTALAVLAVLISLMIFAPRRRPKKKSP